MGFYRSISMLYPPKFRKKLYDLAMAANVKVVPERFIGFVLVSSLAVALAGSFFVTMWLGINLILSFLGLFAVIQSAFYLMILISADQKTKAVEEALPDALQLMASNLRAGISIEKSLILAARPEFGPLKEEIEAVGRDVATGGDVGKALQQMCKRVRSKALHRVVQLIIMGLKAGGKLATLLENSSEDLRSQREIREKIRSTVQTYIIFIFVASAIGAPLLFSLSLFLVEVIIKSFGSIDIPQAAAYNLPISIGSVSISTAFLMKFIIVALVTTSIMSSFMLGMISRGKIKEGAKYIIVLITLSLGLFFLGSFMLRSMFGGLFDF